MDGGRPNLGDVWRKLANEKVFGSRSFIGYSKVQIRVKENHMSHKLWLITRFDLRFEHDETQSLWVEIFVVRKILSEKSLRVNKIFLSERKFEKFCFETLIFDGSIKLRTPSKFNEILLGEKLWCETHRIY